MFLLTAFIDVLLPIIVVVAAGYALRRGYPIDVRSLNRVAMYALSPALIFVTLVRAEVAGLEALRVSAVSVLLVGSLLLLTTIIGKALRLDRPSLAALLLTVLFMNSGNYGLNTSRFAFGQAGLDRALLFFVAQATLAQTLAVPVAQLGRADMRAAALQILKMPQIYAVLAGLILRLSGLDLPHRSDALGALFKGGELLSDAALTMLLLMLGMQLAQGAGIEDRRLTLVALGLRLMVSPLLAWGIGVALGLDALALKVVIVQASMPTAVNMVVYSTEFDARPSFVAGVVVAGTLASLVTLSLLLTFLR